MAPDDRDLLLRHPEWLAVLQAYWDVQQTLKKTEKEFDGWMARLADVPSIARELLSGVHGKLIAFGYLKFELTPKDTSLRYQLTPLGRMAVTGEHAAEGAEAAQEHDWAQSA